jgi:polyhydroxyalkanoate synthesis regulator phasin
MADKGIQITGDGNVVGNHNRVEVRKGGIRAEHIEAENVVDGVMAPQAALAQAAELVKLARAIERGGIDAETIKARNVVSGLYVPAAQNVAELHQEVAALRQNVLVALEAGEVADDADAEDVAAALTTAEAELAKPEPSGTRVVRKLKEAAEVLTGVAEAATAAGKVGQAVIKLAPVAMMLWKLAETLF